MNLSKGLCLFSGIISLYSTLGWSATLCETNMPKILDAYAKRNRPVSSYQIKSCKKVIPNLGPVFGERRGRGVPVIQNTDACVVILELGPNYLQNLVVYDPMNDFYLNDLSPNPDLDVSRFGDRETGTLLFIEGRQIPGRSRMHDEIIRGDYHFGTDQVHLKKWHSVHAGWGNKYTHDYSVQCEPLQ